MHALENILIRMIYVGWSTAQTVCEHWTCLHVDVQMKRWNNWKSVLGAEKYAMLSFIAAAAVVVVVDAAAYGTAKGKILWRLVRILQTKAFCL